jgi:large subunit ribosomal protein L32
MIYLKFNNFREPMAPLPKRKHSTQRKGKRLNHRESETNLPKLVKCPNCGKEKMPHRICRYCGK